MKKSIFSSLLVLALSLGAQAGYAIPTELVNNGGFEDGLADWTASRNVRVWESHGSVMPYSGSRMAVLSPWGGYGNSHLFQSIQIDTSGYDYFDISFAYNSRVRERWPNDRPDRITVGLGPESFTPILIHPPANCEAVQDTQQVADDAYCESGWNRYAVTGVSLPDAGLVTLDVRFDLENVGTGGDWRQQTTAYIDDVSILGYGNGTTSAVPVPGTLALFGAGLLGLAGVRRRQTTLAS